MAEFTSIAPATTDGENLPEALRPLFWDCDFDTVTWREHRDYIVGRVLSGGTWQAICWLRDRVDNDELREWIIGRQGRGLSSRQLRFWEVVLQLPGPIVDRWLNNAGRKLWEGRGRG